MNDNYLRQLLNDWGDWVDRAALHSGYPPQSSIVAAKEPVQAHDAMTWPLPGGGSYRYALPNRHAILCFDMPGHLVPIHQAILRLDPELRGAVSLWYAYGVKPTPVEKDADRRPVIWYREDKARYIGMTYGALQRRASRARTAIKWMLRRRVDYLSEKVVELSIVDTAL